MPYEEFNGWMLFFKHRPVGWQEDQRTYLLLSAQGVKKKPQEIFPTLSTIYSSRNGSSVIDPTFLRMLQKGKEGDKDWKPIIED